MNRSTLAQRMLMIGAVALLSAACDEEKPKPKPPEPPKQVVKEEPKEDPLKEAKAEATTKGQMTAVGRADKAQLVAAAIEANTKEVAVVKDTNTKPRVRNVKPRSYKGKIDPGALAKEVRRYDGAMKACYERSLKRAPGLEGKVRLTMVIGSDGSTKSAKARGISLNDSTVNRCIETHARKMKFPAPKGGAAQINKTYAFKPEV